MCPNLDALGVPVPTGTRVIYDLVPSPKFSKWEDLIAFFAAKGKDNWLYRGSEYGCLIFSREIVTYD